VSQGLRWIVPAVLMTGLLILITSRQVALFPPDATRGSELLPWPLMGGLVAVAVGFRVERPSLATHLALLMALTFGLALLGAQLGQPLANATADYCGDLCRTAIIGRFVAFFGWPVLAAIALWAIARSEARTAGEAAAERASWTRSWAVVTLLMGVVAAIAWWRIILPNG